MGQATLLNKPIRVYKPVAGIVLVHVKTGNTKLKHEKKNRKP